MFVPLECHWGLPVPRVVRQPSAQGLRLGGEEGGTGRREQGQRVGAGWVATRRGGGVMEELAELALRHKTSPKSGDRKKGPHKMSLVIKNQR